MSYEDTIHWAEYIPYTGLYALCAVDKPELDIINARLSNLFREVSCPECLKRLEERRNER